jgi:hypothetical protein
MVPLLLRGGSSSIHNHSSEPVNFCGKRDTPHLQLTRKLRRRLIKSLVIKKSRWYYTSYPWSCHDLTLLLYLYPGDTRVFSRFARLLLVLWVLPSLWGINMKRHTGLLFLQPPFFTTDSLFPTHIHITHLPCWEIRRVGVSLQLIHNMLVDHPFW